MTSRHPDEGSRRLHVLHVSASASGDVATVTLGYVRDQVDRGWTVSVASSSRGALGYDAREAGARALWWRAEQGPGRRIVGEYLRLARLIDEADPDVVHLHGAKAGLVGRLVLRNKVPTVYQPHPWSHPGTRGTTLSASRRWERFATRWTAVTVCSSDGERAEGGRLGIDGRTMVIRNGVELPAFRRQGPRDRAVARTLLGLPDVPTVVCLGELTPDHGQEDLLEAWPSVLRQAPEARLMVVGDGPERSRLVRQAVDLSGVILVGARSDLRAWLAAADVVAVPVRSDGPGLVAVEAMASARSVVATAVSGVVECVPDEAGAIVSPRDPEALAAAIGARLTQPAKADAEGRAGRTHVEANYDAAASAHELARVYLRLVGERRAR